MTRDQPPLPRDQTKCYVPFYATIANSLVSVKSIGAPIILNSAVKSGCGLQPNVNIISITAGVNFIYS